MSPEDKDKGVNATALSQILVEHENRLNRLDWEVGILNKQMPTARWKRTIWWLAHGYYITLPAVVLAIVLFAPSPWDKAVGGALVGAHLGKYVTELAFTVAKGPRKINSSLLDAYEDRSPGRASGSV